MNATEHSSQAGFSPLAGRWPRLRRRALPLGAAALLVLGAAWLAWRQHNLASTPHYSLATVTRGEVTRAILSTGTVNPVLTITVGTYVSGVIKELSCDYNTRVRRGQVCAKIDPRPYQTVVDQDRANLAMARAQLDKDRANLGYAELAWRRNRELLTSDSISRDAYDNSRSAYDQARAQVELDTAAIQQRSAELAAAEVNLGYTDIVSPVDGIVVSRNVTMGQTVAASFQTPTLFLIATDLTRMQVDTNVSESDIGGVRLGQTGSFSVEAYPERSFGGRVVQVRQAPQTVQNVVTYDVVLEVANPGLLLKPGMTATARIVTAERRDVLRVPDQALRYQPGGIGTKRGKTAASPPGQGQVWVLRAGRPQGVALRLGVDDDSYSEVLAGSLKEGDPLIVGEQATSASNAPRLRF